MLDGATREDQRVVMVDSQSSWDFSTPDHSDRRLGIGELCSKCMTIGYVLPSRLWGAFLCGCRLVCRSSHGGGKNGYEDVIADRPDTEKTAKRLQLEMACETKKSL